ncbi:MAG: hypothetical protein IKK34_14745 [Clostridia bacterium]|nr:hypothetical protein [Clostridia bacterium]MBR3797264.1 hypothetical protein [Clostridia bacterium]
MQNPIKWAVGWVADALVEKITEPIDKINKRLDRLESLHEQDAAALEADLSVMDDRICCLIGMCRRRGYTTSDERRRVTRMHDAYKARGGNHGEENEYAAFLKLPTQEEFERMKA